MAKDVVGEHMTAEMVPFFFPVDGGKEVEVKEAPFVYARNLIATLSDFLSSHHLYVPNTCTILKCRSLSDMYSSHT